MTVKAGASSAISKWSDIDWKAIKEGVNRLQMRIAKATKQGKIGKVKALQWILVHSYYAKLLACKRVTSSKGSRTAGIDGKLYKTDSAKIKLASSLKVRGYKASPTRRVYIPKKGSEQRFRPLSIPTIYDRSMQALYFLALESIAENHADENSYGFRQHRSAADAIEQIFVTLCQKYSACWILECDIESCFNKISHQWLLENILIDKRILTEWLKVGYIDKQRLFPTYEGSAQGSIISPILANITLDGLEKSLNAISKKSGIRIHTIRYADDIVCVAKNKEVLEEQVKPLIEEFLKVRGLNLSQEKTKITHIEQGIEFLGFQIKKFKKKVITKPSKASVKTFLKEIRNVIRNNKTVTTEILISMLNPKIRGWCNYFRNSSASVIFAYIDDQIYRYISRWTVRRHDDKNISWIRKKYFRKVYDRNWVFFDEYVKDDGSKNIIDLVKATSFKIRRHVKIKKAATAYDPEFKEYLADRKRDMIARKHVMRKVLRTTYKSSNHCWV